MKLFNHLVKKYSVLTLLFIGLTLSPYVLAYSEKHSASANAPRTIQGYFKNQEYEKVIVHGNNFLKLYPKDTDVLYLVGLAHYKQKQYQQAVDAFTKIVNLSNKYEDVWSYLTQCYINLNNYPAALHVANNGLKAFPKNSELIKKKTYLENQKSKIIKQAENQVLYNKQNKPEQKTTKPITKQKITSAVTYEDILKAYKANQYNKVISLSKQYLAKAPKDNDVRNLLALSYMKTKQYNAAELEYRKMLAGNNKKVNIRTALINALFAQEKYHDVIIESDKGIATGVGINQWYYEQAKAYYMLTNYQASVKTLEKISDLATHPKAKKLYDTINEETGYRYLAHNEFGMFNSHIQVRNPDQPWNVSSLYGLRKNDYGAFGGFVRYQHRPHVTGYQWGLVAEPTVTKTTYLDLAYAYSDQPALFANDYYYGEIYQYLPWDLQVSAGDDYRKIQNTNLNAYTGSLAKTVSNYTLGFRPTHYVPKSGAESTLYKVYLTRYGANDPDRQIKFSYANGQSPDLFDLETVNFFKLDDEIFYINGQEPLNKRLLFQYGLGYEEQKFPNGKIRRLYYIDVGAKFRDV